MDNHVCPHLGTLDQQFNRGPYIDYPSFENRCLAIADFGDDEASIVMLTDQATFCLASGHQHCPRFQAARKAQAAASQVPDRPEPTLAVAAAQPLESDWLHANLDDLGHEIADMLDEPSADRRTWGWIGAGLIFLLVFLCGGTFATYLGWQVVRSNFAAQEPGTINTLAAVPPIITQQPLFMLVTATSEADTPPDPNATPTVGAVLIQPEPTATFNFPPAVTATLPPQGQVQSVQPVVPPPTAQPIAAQPVAAQPVVVTPEPTSVVNVNAVVPVAPTRRPTPTFEIPTSTPTSELPTATVTPTYGPPVVILRPKVKQLKPGECTDVFWKVQNVREVYFEGLGVSGEGSREECVDDEDEVYELLVVLPSGFSEVYTTTVTVLLPTATPTPTATWTPVPVYTATWTPVPPTPIPTPNITYGVNLAVGGGSNQSCAAGGRCSIAITTSNLGNQLDNLTVAIVGADRWTSQLCRRDGVCASNTITLYNVGPGTAGEMDLVVEIPADAGAQNAVYTVQASSGNTGGAVRSDAINIQIAVP